MALFGTREAYIDGVPVRVELHRRNAASPGRRGWRNTTVTQAKVYVDGEELGGNTGATYEAGMAAAAEAIVRKPGAVQGGEAAALLASYTPPGAYKGLTPSQKRARERKQREQERLREKRAKEQAELDAILDAEDDANESAGGAAPGEDAHGQALERARKAVAGVSGQAPARGKRGGGRRGRYKTRPDGSVEYIPPEIVVRDTEGR